MAQNRDNNSPLFVQSREKPKDLLEAISEIEILSAAEEDGAEIHERLATLKDRMDYFNLGLRSIFTGTIISLFLAPLCSAVINQDIPIFGQMNSTTYDKILAYIFSFGYSIGFTLLFVYIAKLRGGTVSNIYSNNILIGMSIGAVLKLMITAFIYGLLYIFVFTTSNINYLITSIINSEIVETNMINLIYILITAIGRNLIPAIYIYGITTIFIITIPWCVRAIYKIKNSRRTEI